ALRWIILRSPRVLVIRNGIAVGACLSRRGDRRYSAFPGNLQSRPLHRRNGRMERTMGETVNVVRDARRRAAATRGGAYRVAARSGVALALGTLLLAAAPAVRATSDAELATNARLLASARSEDAAGVARALHDGAAVDSRNRLGET